MTRIICRDDGVMRKRVLIAAYFDPTLPGGGSQFSVDVARVWLKRGFAVHVLCSDHERQYLDLTAYASSGQLVVHSISDFKKIFFAHEFDQDVYQRAKKLLNEIAPESVHVHNFHGLLSAAWAAVDLGIPTFYTALDFGLVCQDWYLYDGTPTPCTGPEPRKCEACLLRQHQVGAVRQLVAQLPSFLFKVVGKNPKFHKSFAGLNTYYRSAGQRLDKMLDLLPRFSGVFTISPATGPVLERYGVLKDRIHLHVQGFTAPGASQITKTNNGPVRLLFLGHFSHIKGFQVLAAALEKLPDGLALEIWIYGREALRLQANASSRLKRYLRAGNLLVGDEVDRELSQSDGLVIPSLWAENTPYAVLRTLAAGRPVISAHQKGLSHLVQDGFNGFLVPVGDVNAWAQILQRVAENPALLRNMQTHCAYKKTDEEYCDEIEKVLAGK